LISGNVTPSAFVVGWLTHLFNRFQTWRGGTSFPVFPSHAQRIAVDDDLRLTSNDRVRVRSAAEIRPTLNDRLMHRGLWFEPDMLKHCGQPYSVASEVTRLVDIVTGEIRTMKTPAYILQGVHFSGERQLFNAQYEPLFWRSAWLEREGGSLRRSETSSHG
jgi:hypothetical protein